jgi:Tol biopolymer transport system component
MTRRFLLAAALGLSCLLGGCLGGNLRPLQGLNLQLARVGTSHSPGLSGNWLALITGRQGREQVLLVNLSNSAPVPLLGLNRPDAQPLSVTVDQRGERLALVRQREGRTELVLYRRSLQNLQAIPMEPAGVPRRVQLSADGRVLAVEVSRGGQWQVDLLTLP